MADIRKIIELYEIYHSYKRVGRELNISHNTVRKYILRINAVKSGTLTEILPKDRVIKQPLHVITDEIRKKIAEHAKTIHTMDPMPPDILAKVKAAIKP